MQWDYSFFLSKSPFCRWTIVQYAPRLSRSSFGDPKGKISASSFRIQTLLNDSSVFHDYNPVGICDSRQSMSNNDSCSSG